MGKNNNKIKLGGEEAVKVIFDLDRVAVLLYGIKSDFTEQNSLKIN
jgi:hypothetical protein